MNNVNKDTRSIFPMKQNSSKFTLIELLVVISIVALLIAILLPALASARDAARAIECSVRLKNLGVLSITYVQDNKEYLPYPNWSWRGKIAKYITPQRGMSSLFYCPSAEVIPSNKISSSNCAYTSSYPDSKKAWRMTDDRYVREPLSLIKWLQDSPAHAGNNYRAGDWNSGKALRHHKNSAYNRLFWDGHVDNAQK